MVNMELSFQRIKRKSSDAFLDKPQGCSALVTPPMPLYSSTPPWEGDSSGFQAMTARRRLLRRTSSFSGSSVTSNSSLDNDLTCDVPWTEEELVKVDAALAQITEQAACLDTPFVGPPPSQLTHNVARHLCRSKTWKHSLKSTRAKILEAAKETTQWKMDVDDTPLPRDVEETPRRSKRLARQNSSDVMVAAPRNGMTLARLSHKLQRSDSSDSDALSRVALTRHRTLDHIDPAEAYPTPPRSQRLKRATSMAIRDRAAPALERSSSTSDARPSGGPDLSLFGAALSRPAAAGLSTPFEPAFAYGLRPKRVPLLRKLSGLHIHSSPSSPTEEKPVVDSPFSSSPTSSMLRYSTSSSQTSASAHDYFSHGFSSSDAIAGRSVRRSTSTFGVPDRLGLA